jgi:hypothetical protein
MTRTLPPGARNTDPSTSHKAGDGMDGKRPSQRQRLLVAYHGNHLGIGGGLTDDEAVRAAGHEPAEGLWRRCSELRDLGAIEPVRDVLGTLVTRLSERGKPAEVCAITGYGIRAVFDPMLVRGSPDKRISLVDRQIRESTSVAEVRELWKFHQRNGTLTSDVQRKLRGRARDLLEGNR